MGSEMCIRDRQNTRRSRLGRSRLHRNAGVLGRFINWHTVSLFCQNRDYNCTIQTNLKFMSTLHHEDLLLSIYEGLLYELKEAGHDINTIAAQEVAEIRANQIFEEMCQ